MRDNSLLAKRVSFPERVVFRDLGGEAVILELETGHYYGLDEVGTQMWNRLRQHGGVRAAYRDLKGDYEVLDDDLQRDLLRFVEDLASRKLLELHEA